MVKLLMSMLYVKAAEGNLHAVIVIKEWESGSFTVHEQRQEK